jgi:hypothetical protein
MKTEKYIYQVIDPLKYASVFEVNLSGLTNYDGSTNTFYGTVLIEDYRGLKDFTGEHGSNDFLDEFGFKLILNPKHFNYDN